MYFARDRGGGGGCLGQHWRRWESWGADRWVVEVLRFGYRVTFLATTPLSNVPTPLPSYSPSSIRGLALTAAVADLRDKGAIEPAPPSPGYYSRLFVTSQSHRGCHRPLLSQPVCSCLPFPHGNSTVGPPVSASWGLDGFSGPEGSLP